MAFNINVANSCKLLSLRAKRYDATSTQASIVFTDLETTATYSTVMAYDNTGKGNLNVPVANLPSAKEPVESAEPLIKASPPNTT